MTPRNLSFNSDHLQVGVDLLLAIDFYMYMHMQGKKYLAASAVLPVALLVLFSVTSPEEVEIGVLLAPVVIVLLTIFSLISLLLANISKFGPRKRFLDAFAISAVATLLLVLSSIGDITIYDLIVILIFIIISAIYIRKNIR